MSILKAISLTRPWPHAILHLGKRVENRSHAQFARHRGPLLLHAAKSWEDDIDTPLGVAWDDPLLLRTKSAHPTGIVGRCRVVAAVRPCWYCDGRGKVRSPPGRYSAAAGDLKHECTVPQCVKGATFLDDDLNTVLAGHHVSELIEAEDVEAELRWWQGGHAIVLADVEALEEPIPWRGALGLWRAPDELLELLPKSWRP